ncbi:MAG TPA: ribonucleoside-triphosphate reductase, adenosylcobalamin-dependent [Leptolyngbyaceae cyanobacterium]
MVRELERKRQSARFPESAPAANPVFFRTYSRRTEAGLRETWDEVCDRTLKDLIELGKLTAEEVAILEKSQRNLKALPSGRWLWVGGTDWINKSKNFSGAYNCTSTNLKDWKAFGLMMNLAMMGCGTGAVIEPQHIHQLPPIRNRLNVIVQGEIGTTAKNLRREYTQTHIEGNNVTIYVGDSREGWVESYQALLELSTDERFTDEVQVFVDVSDVRQAGETLKGFGGVANPVKLPGLYQRCAAILNKAVGRQLNSVECCLLIDEAAVTIVAGNIRRCIAYGTRVSAVNGMIPIQDIQLGDLVLTSSGEYRAVVNKFVQGVQDVVEIRTSITSIRCTANHRVAVYDGLRSYKWKYAGELEPGDRLISVPHLQGQPCSTTDWAWLVGFFIGDGHADLESTKRRNGGGGVVSFAISTERLQGQLGQKILRILSSLGYNPALRVQGNCANINVYRKDFAQELGQYKKPWGCPVIPEFVWRGNREIRAAFLAGLSDADGTPSRNVLVNSNKLEFLREIQKLALSLGIATTLQERKPRAIKGRDKVYDGCHWLHIKGLQSQVVTVGLINQFAIRNGYSLRLAKKNGLTLPYQFVQELAATGWQPNTLSRANVVWVDPKGRPGKFRDANFDTLISEDLVNPHWLPIEVQFVAPAGQAETFDIEVESDHEFIADGLLVHNSAGMRQFTSDDQLGANAKDNLWQQDENGNWRIDPERDALRMANHSRVFHHKPTLQESIDAVRKQYYSGEGAIQWAGEAVARANIDLLSTPELKKEFLQAYEDGNAKQWLNEHYPQIDANELEHRLSRYGLNPCHAGDTLVSTDQGLIPIKDLVGKKFKALVDLRSVGLDGVRLTDAIAFATGVQTTYVINLQNGQQMRCTADHRHFTNQGWVATKDLTSEHSIYIQKGAGCFGQGTITVEQSQMLGWLYGDGSIYKGAKGLDAVFYINQKEFETAFPVLKSAVESLTGYSHQPSFIKGVHTFHSGSSLMRTFLEKLGVQSKECLPDRFLSESQEVIIGFLQGLFCADGCVNVKGRNIELRNRSRELLKQLQVILLNLGIKSSLIVKQKPGDVGIPYTLKDGTKKISQNRGSWRLIIYSGSEARKYWQLIGFPLTPDKQEKLEKLANKTPLRIHSEAFVSNRFTSKVKSIEEFGEETVYDLHVPLTHSFIANGCITHNCGEIIGSDFHCNLSEVHLNQIDPFDYQEQEEAFTAGALSVATLLNHKFQEPRYQYSRELDPIVGVSFTGLFDFFVHAFGVDWLRWWEEGRPETTQGLAFKREEEKYLTSWREIVHRVVWEYCDRHNIKRPNRCTTVQPSGTKSLLTGASPGWHPPKAQRFIRRITFRKNDPVALACIDYGYNVIPSQSDKDEQGNLLNDPFDPRVTEWLVEIPVAVSWADLAGADTIEISKFGAIAQMDFYMQVQKFYVTHNTSATIELREHEVETLGTQIWQAIQNDEGYISAALLARFDDHQTFPRLPFEPISKATYEQMLAEVAQRRKTDDFYTVLSRYDFGELMEVGPAGCDSDKCMMPEQSPN